MATTYTYTGGFDGEINMTDYNVSGSGNFRYVDGSKLVSQAEANNFKWWGKNGDTSQRATFTWLKNNDSDYPYANTDILTNYQLIPAKTLYRKFEFRLDRNVNWFHIHNGHDSTSCITISKLNLSFYNNKGGYGSGTANGATGSSARATYEYRGTEVGSNGFGKRFKLWGSGVDSGWFQVCVEITISSRDGYNSTLPIWVEGTNVKFTGGYPDTSIANTGNNSLFPPTVYNTPANVSGYGQSYSNFGCLVPSSGTQTLTWWWIINCNGNPSNINPFTSVLHIKL